MLAPISLKRTYARIVLFLFILLPTLPAPPLHATEPKARIQLHWLEGPPASSPGVTWGLPWPRGTVQPQDRLVLKDSHGQTLPMQHWPLAYWPDGSLKWTAHALPPQQNPPDQLFVEVHSAPESTETTTTADSSSTLTLTDLPEYLLIDTGRIRCCIPRQGPSLIQTMERNGKTILHNLQLIALRQDCPQIAEDASAQRQRFIGQIQQVDVEQAGPLRMVIRLQGAHHHPSSRTWLPWIVRLYFYAGADHIRLMHTFILDGNEHEDFLAGLGVRFGVPLSDQLYNRHVRFAGQDGGLFAEAVQTLTGLRRPLPPQVRQAQILGQFVQEEDLRQGLIPLLQYVPAWGDFSLIQFTCDSFEIRKRTRPGHGWIRAAVGGRAAGLGYIGGAQGGGVAFGLRDFWQRYPTQLDIRHAAADQAEVTVWLYAPDAPPMDLRFYHDGLGMDTYPKQRQGLEITYEDYEPGWGTPIGIARTSELMLWALESTPPRETLVQLAQLIQHPPLLVAQPQDYKNAGVFGPWSLPDRSTPARAAIENQLDYLLDLYLKQVEQRRWYGFWDYGDVMHSYDPDRHEWSYDVGGFAWANSELSPDLWLWYSFLRSGRADVFRMAEAMTRHTGEVDVYHAGRFRFWGTRHGVQHWGDSSKQPRVSTAAYRRIFYYLTADERTGDLLREQVQAYRQSPYINIGRKLTPNPPPPPDPDAPPPTQAWVGFGTDWGSFAAAWLTEWERTGDPQYRQWLENGMRSIGRLPRGWLAGGALFDLETKQYVAGGDQVGVSHLSAVFGAFEINAELLELLDVPEYEQAWLEYCRLFNASQEEKQQRLGVAFRRPNLGQAHSRLTAYAAWKTKDPQLAQRAWQEFFSAHAGLPVLPHLSLRTISGPWVLRPVEEGFGMSTNAASQWGLAAIQNLALIGEYLPTEIPTPPPPPPRPPLPSAPQN